MVVGRGGRMGLETVREDGVGDSEGGWDWRV